MIDMPFIEKIDEAVIEYHQPFDEKPYFQISLAFKKKEGWSEGLYLRLRERTEDGGAVFTIHDDHGKQVFDSKLAGLLDQATKFAKEHGRNPDGTSANKK